MCVCVCVWAASGYQVPVETKEAIRSSGTGVTHSVICFLGTSALNCGSISLAPHLNNSTSKDTGAGDSLEHTKAWEALRWGRNARMAIWALRLVLLMGRKVRV